MLSTQKLLNTLNEIKEIAKIELALYLPNGKVIVNTKDFMECLEQIVEQFAESEAKQQQYQEYRMYKVEIDHETEYILVIAGEVENAFVIGQMAVCQIRTLILTKSEDFDRNNFIQNVLLGNMLTVDICTKAKNCTLNRFRELLLSLIQGIRVQMSLWNW